MVTVAVSMPPPWGGGGESTNFSLAFFRAKLSANALAGNVFD
jgi:hypothetical protein